MKNQLMSLILFLTIGIVNTACAQSWDDGKSVSAKGSMQKKSIELDDFSGVGLSLDAKVYIRQGNEQSVEIEAKESVLENIKRDVKGDFWNIGFEKRMNNYGDITVWITVPYLTKLSVSGSGDIIGKGRFDNLEDITLAVSGSGGISLDAVAKNASCLVTGSGNIRLSGNSDDQKISITGSGNVESFDFKSNECVVRITGSGDCEVNASENLEVYITGSGDVSYKGDPNLRSRILGSGDVRSRGK